MDASVPKAGYLPVLSEDELGPVDIIRGAPGCRLLIHVDHGGNDVPRSLAGLGLSQETLNRHVGWDIGAAMVSRHLAKHLNCTAIIARYSRLVIDVNRALGDPDNIPATSDGFLIPGNATLGREVMEERVKALYWPYHQAIDWELAHMREGGLQPAILSVHSFTPALMKRNMVKPRPWHCGVMFSRDTRFGDHLIAGLRSVPGMSVGVNEPYSGITHGYCAKMHGLSQSLPHVQIEIRQDLICNAAGQAWWADLLAKLVAPILDQPDMNDVRHY